MATNNPKGASAKGSSSSFDNYEKKPDDDINKAADEGVKQVTEYVQKVGAEKKFSFSLDSLKNLGLPELPALDMDFLNNIFGPKFSALLNGKLSFLKNAAQESLKELMYIGKDFLVNLIQVGIDMIMSRIYITDEAILLELKAAEKMGSNIRYNSDWIRKYMISIDYVKTVTWIDNKYGFSYDWNTAKSRIKSDTNTAARNSCIKILYYMLDFVYVEKKALANKIRIKEKWFETYDREKLNEKHRELVEEIEGIEDLPERKELEAEADRILKMIEHANQKWAENPKMDKDHEKDKKQLDEMENFIAKTIKNMIVYSLGNLNLEEMKKFINRFEIKPAWFGSEDEDFNSEYMFSASDIDKMAPFFISHKQFTATDYDRNSDRYTKEQWKSGNFDTSKNSQGMMKNLQDDLGDTRLVQTSKLPQYIVPRNVYIKHIYAYIAEKRLFGADRLTNAPLYERLLHPTMDLLTAAADDAAKNLFNTGLGKAMVDTLLYIERMAYNMVNDKKKMFGPPSKIVYAQLMSYGQYLPPPVYDEDDIESYLDKNNKHPLTNNKNNKDEVKEKEAKKQLIIDLIYYYLENIRATEYRKFFNTIFMKIYELWRDEDDATRKLILEDIIAKYFTNAIKRKDIEFNVDEFINYCPLEQIPIKLIKCLSELEIREYENWYPEPRDMENVFNPFFEEVIKPLLELSMNTLQEKFFDEVMNIAMSPTQVYEYLIYIYTFCGKQSIYIETTEEKEKYTAFIRKYYTEEAYKPGFNISTWLKDVADEDRRDKLLKMMKEIYTFVQKKTYSEFVTKNIWQVILDEILPVFKVSIGLEKDIADLNDPSFLDKIYNQIIGNSNMIVYIKDFDNKIIDITYQSPIGDLSESYDESQYPTNAIN